MLTGHSWTAGNMLPDQKTFVIVAGYIGVEMTTGEKLDLVTKTWSSIAPLTPARYSHASVIYNNSLWILGGRTYNNISESISWWNYETLLIH